jgi:Na+-driven multidrug efflux pump
LISIPIMLIPDVLLSVMLPGRIFTSQELLDFRIVFFVIPLLPLASSSIIYFQAVGEGKVSSLLSVGREIILFIPLIFLVPVYYGMAGIYYGIAIENVIYVVIVFSITQVALRKRTVFRPNLV